MLPSTRFAATLDFFTPQEHLNVWPLTIWERNNLHQDGNCSSCVVMMSFSFSFLTLTFILIFPRTHRVSDSSETRPKLPTLIHPSHAGDARCGCRSPAWRDQPRSITNAPCWTFTVPEVIIHSSFKFLPVRPWNIHRPSLPSQTRCRVVSQPPCCESQLFQTHIYNFIHTVPHHPPLTLNLLILSFCVFVTYHQTYWILHDRPFWWGGGEKRHALKAGADSDFSQGVVGNLPSHILSVSTHPSFSTSFLSYCSF